MRWDDLKIFLAVADATSMRAAAKQLKVSHSKVSRRIESLEDDLGAKLFDRLPDGYRLTETGQELLPIALETDENLHSFGLSVSGRDSTLDGQVCVTIPDVLVVSIFMTLFTTFMEEYPSIQIKVSDTYDLFDLSRREADVAIRITNVPPEHLIGRCLGKMHQAAYATREYIQKYKPELKKSQAKWIGWGRPENHPTWVDGSPFPHLGVTGSFNNILIQCEAAKQQAGIGYFPCFLGDSTPGLVRLSDPEPYMDVWLLSHRDLRAAARMRAFRQHIMQHIPEIKTRLEGTIGEDVINRGR